MEEKIVSKCKLIILQKKYKTDTAIANKLKVSRTTVWFLRNKYGIKIVRKTEILPENIEYPNIFKYDNYRELIKKIKNKNDCSYQKLTRFFKLTSESFLSDVIQGRKKINGINIYRISKGLKLSGIEANYFEAMVRHDNAKGEMKEYYKEALGVLRKIKRLERG